MVLLVTEGHGHGSREAVGVEVILLVAEGAEYGSGVAVGVKVALLVTEGVVELGVGLSLSSSQSSATDLSMRSEPFIQDKLTFPPTKLHSSHSHAHWPIGIFFPTI